MRLKKLWVKDYKNLKDFTIDFETSDGLTMIIGNNGSGKSNVLELLSGIFSDTYTTTGKYIINSDYLISFEINNITYDIKNNQNRRSFYQDGKVISKTTAKTSGVFPKNVVALYSGEDEYLYKTYFLPFEKEMVWENSKLRFINKDYWDIAIFSFLCSPIEDIDGTTDTNLKFMNTILDGKDIKKSLLFINPNHIYTNSERADKNLYNSILLTSPKHYEDDHQEYLTMSDSEFISEYKFIPNKNYSVGGKYYFIELSLEDGHILMPDTDKIVFQTLSQSIKDKKNGFFLGVECLTDSFVCSRLSEGEKRLILIRAILDIVANENSLILLDEPDSHIHEGRKKELYELIQYYTEFSRQIILTSHSPTMVHIAKENQLVMLEVQENSSKVISQEKIKTLQAITPQGISVVEQSMVFNSDKPLVIFEGKTDVQYVKKAISVLADDENGYKNINVDFLSFNGTGNAKSFIDELMGIVSAEKKLIVFFDRDDAGRNGASAVLGISKDHEDLVKFNKCIKCNIIVDFLPYKNSIEKGDFLIEDYFDYEMTIKPIIDKLMDMNHHPIKNLPKLGDRIKKEIEKNFDTYHKNQFKGFQTLIEKIKELIK